MRDIRVTRPRLSAGGTIKPIGLSAVDAAWLRWRNPVHDAQDHGCPREPSGAQLDRSVPNLEQDLTVWFRFGLGPELNDRIRLPQTTSCL
jgi:hypothetical protein